MGLGAFKLVANGKDITATVKPFFKSLNITDASGIDADSFSLTLMDDGKIAFPRAKATMEIYTGIDEASLKFRGSFTVNSAKITSPDSVISIEGDAADLGGSFKTQRDYTWQKQTLKELLETVAARNGYTLGISDQYAEIPTPHILQVAQSDADLVTDLAKEHGATMKIAKKTLLFTPQGDNKSVSGTDLPAIPIHLTDEVEAEITLAGAGNFQTVQAHWQDVAQGLKQSVKVGEGGKTKKLPKTYPDEASALAAADAELARQQRGDYQLSLSELPFVPGLKAERNILLSGHLRKEFNSYWMCDSVTETIDENGHVMSAEFVVPKSGAVVPHMGE